jgi:DNA replication and repair protein RecF
VWVEKVEIADVRNLQDVRLALDPGLNVFVGRNAQGKTTLLEAVALLARGRSFRTDEVATLVRRGAPGLTARGLSRTDDRGTELEVQVTSAGRRLCVDGREVPPRSYHGRLEVAVYSTDRLKVVRGPMRERRQYVDRQAAALWPAYRQTLREYDRVLQQRNATLQRQGGDLPAWDERLCAVGARLRQRRAVYVERLQASLRTGFSPRGERYGIAVMPGTLAAGEPAQEARLQAELAAARADERRAGRSLAGPHRDPVALSVDGHDAAAYASSGQARSLLLALALAGLEVYRAETGSPAVALLDDLDSELDEERATALCMDVTRNGQALVTTAHEGWARRLGAHGRLFAVEAGRVGAA